MKAHEFDEKVFWSKVIKTPRGCWEWTGVKIPCGYGTLNINTIPRAAHRVAYKLAKGSIPPNMCVCHRCDNKACINPDHLFLGTHQENMWDRDDKGRGKLPDNTGVKNGMAKLTPEKVKELRALHPIFNYEALSALFNTPITTIQSALRRETWSSIPKLTPEEVQQRRLKYAMQYT